MVKLFNDTFNINEIIDSNITEVLLENEFAITGGAPDIEKIITVEGEANIYDSIATTDAIIIDGELAYNIIYRSDSMDYTHSIRGEIPFREEIALEGVTEDMEVATNAWIDYIEAEQVTEDTYIIKAVIVLESDVYMRRPVTYVANLESDGSIQAKSKNISYTDTVADLREEINISDAIEVSKGSDQVHNILKADSDVYITNIDILNDKILLEGICRLGFIFLEDNDLRSTGYISEDFPFTHYMELDNVDSTMLREIDIKTGDIDFSISENFDDEKKLIEFTLPFTIDASFYTTRERNIIVDSYSTDYNLEVKSEKVNLQSLVNIIDEVVKFDDTFDILSGMIKDIYSVDVSPKVSESRIDGNDYIIDGFLDVNMLYLNGEVNKIDKGFASLPFTATIPIHEDEAQYIISSHVNTNRCSAYRKGSNSVNLNCDINVSLKFKNNEEITIVQDIIEDSPIDRSKMPSLLFRVVQQGESLWDIGKNYNLSINNIRELNEISDDNILEPGSKIIIARTI